MSPTCSSSPTRSSAGSHESGRLEWAREECRRLESATDERDPMTAWERLPRVGQLDPRSRAVARELAAWRERTASELDRPVGSILADPALVELAKRHPSSISGLEQIRGLHPPTIKRRGEAILEAIARGRDAEPIPRDEARARSESGDAPLIALAEALLRARSLEAGLAYELIASRAELEQIVGAARRHEPEPEVRTLTGWRRELVGDDLRDLLAGHTGACRGRRPTAARAQEDPVSSMSDSAEARSNMVSPERGRSAAHAGSNWSRCPAGPGRRWRREPQLMAGRVRRLLLAVRRRRWTSSRDGPGAASRRAAAPPRSDRRRR